MKEILKLIPIKDIHKNPYQPRIHFDQEALEELSLSIKENGLIQPIIVRESDILGYELIAGERRLRASKLAGLETIPAIIKPISDEDSIKQAIIENLQRADLNPIEEAKAYQNLITQQQLTHDELALFMGKSRPYITNVLRLLNLPQEIRRALEEGVISQGHARLLVGIKSKEKQFYWFEKIQKEALSVRELEKKVHTTKPAKTKRPDLFILEKEKDLQKSLGLPVTIKYSKNGKGSLTINFTTEEDFNRVINKLN
ncbi:ParB/RepB/Spo0J family partition protein [Streptococcus pacificus]|uniref:ParB/RepB/Spo0J family partition protein n=1 Tax=Streptococcus pacificus TaxID=2740577 RepID=A0ABS0ZK07_9STRE|nr:ParB/RepB/Spo0J family partition protein [Streptococcus pacificus]MBJ8326340.1 ParB/RepB/Spo0J family partition protein [Streptococcus pacificus]